VFSGRAVILCVAILWVFFVCGTLLLWKKNSLNLAISQDKADDISNLTPAPVPAVGSLHPVSRRTRTLTRTVSYVSSVDRTADVRHIVDGWSVDGNSTTVTGIESGGDAAASDRASTNGNTDGMGKEGHNMAAHVLPIWLVGSTPNEFTVGSLDLELSCHMFWFLY
jgi:hypothetical protein